MKHSWTICLVWLIDSVLVARLAKKLNNGSIDFSLRFIFVIFGIPTCSNNSLEVAIETLMTELDWDGQILQNALDYGQFAVFDGLFQSFLNVPEHQMLQSSFFIVKFLKSFTIPINRAFDERAAPSQYFHELCAITLLQLFDLISDHFHWIALLRHFIIIVM